MGLRFRIDDSLTKQLLDETPEKMTENNLHRTVPFTFLVTGLSGRAQIRTQNLDREDVSYLLTISTSHAQ